jgi:hypothetical protein
VKRASDALFVIAVVFLVLAIVLANAVLYAAAAVAFVGSVGVTVAKRRRFTSRKAAARP